MNAIKYSIITMCFILSYAFCAFADDVQMIRSSDYNQAPKFEKIVISENGISRRAVDRSPQSVERSIETVSTNDILEAAIEDAYYSNFDHDQKLKDSEETELVGEDMGSY